mgnify:CR=1 FL=1
MLDRCISYGVPNLLAGYNSYFQIFQSADHVVVMQELIHDARVIPIDDSPHLDATVRQLHGDSRGHWDGDTLVVETTHFVDKSHYRWADAWRMPTETLHLVERFTRLDPETLEYEFRVTDPAKFVRPWSVRIPLTTNQAARGVTQGPLYEYACHEGNYSLVNVLSGARAGERAAEAASSDGLK